MAQTSPEAGLFREAGGAWDAGAVVECAEWAWGAGAAVGRVKLAMWMADALSPHRLSVTGNRHPET